MTTFKEIVLAGLRQEASDIHMTYGLPPIFRVDGVLSAFGEERLDDAYIMNVLGQLATAAQMKEMEEVGEIDFAVTYDGTYVFICEGGFDTLSFKFFSSAAENKYIDITGCGITLLSEK